MATFVPLPANAVPDPGEPGSVFVPLPKEARTDAPQLEGFWRTPAMAGSYLAKGALAGAGALGDLEGFLHRQFTSGLYDPLHRAVGLGPADRATEVAAQPSPLSSTTLLAGGRALGAVDRPNLAPQTTGEHYLASTAEGIGGTLPYLWMGGLNPAAIGRNVIQGAAAGAGGEAGAQAFPQYADAARAVAGLGGLALGGKAFDLGNKAVGSIAGTAATTPLQDAYRNLGIEQRLAGDVAQSPFAQMLQGYAARSPLGAGIVNPARERAVGQWGQALDNTASGYGAARTPQEAGTALQNEAVNWFGNFRQAQSAAEQAVAAKVPVTAQVDLAPVNQVLNAATRRMPGLPSVAGIHNNPTFQKLQTALAADAPTGVARWEDIRQWRTAVGEELEKSLVSQDGNQAAWRQLYGSLSQSLGRTAFNHNASNEWQAANEVTSQGHQFIERILNNVINHPNPAQNTITAENAYSAAMTGAQRGGTILNDIRQQMPAAADELAAAKLLQSGRATMQNAAGTEISPRTLVSNLSPNRLAPEARDALFGHNPALAQRVEDLTRVGEGMRRGEGYYNWSGTGGHIATGQLLAGLGGAGYGAYKGYMDPENGGLWGAATGAIGPAVAALAPGYIAGHAVTYPGLTRFLATPSMAPAASLPSTVLKAYPELRGLLDADSWTTMQY